MSDAITKYVQEITRLRALQDALNQALERRCAGRVRGPFPESDQTLLCEGLFSTNMRSQHANKLFASVVKGDVTPERFVETLLSDCLNKHLMERRIYKCGLKDLVWLLSAPFDIIAYPSEQCVSQEIDLSVRNAEMYVRLYCIYSLRPTSCKEGC